VRVGVDLLRQLLALSGPSLRRSDSVRLRRHFPRAHGRPGMRVLDP
jgi:hypothetical protein